MYLGKSLNYARFAVILYGFALFLLFFSSLFTILKIILSFFLLAKLAMVLTNPKPQPEFSMLSFNGAGWSLNGSDQQELIYEKAEIILDVGLFFLLALTEGKKRRYLVIFFDQIDKDFFRFLNIMQKIG